MTPSAASSRRRGSRRSGRSIGTPTTSVERLRSRPNRTRATDGFELARLREKALEVALMSGQQLVNLEEIVCGDERAAACRERMQFELKFVHRPAVLRVHFFAFPLSDI